MEYMRHQNLDIYNRRIISMPFVISCINLLYSHLELQNRLEHEKMSNGNGEDEEEKRESDQIKRRRLGGTRTVPSILGEFGLVSF